MRGGVIQECAVIVVFVVSLYYVITRILYFPDDDELFQGIHDKLEL
jgi:hypothetical protein